MFSYKKKKDKASILSSSEKKLFNKLFLIIIIWFSLFFIIGYTSVDTTKVSPIIERIEWFASLYINLITMK